MHSLRNQEEIVKEVMKLKQRLVGEVMNSESDVYILVKWYDAEEMNYILQKVAGYKGVPNNVIYMLVRVLDTRIVKVYVCFDLFTSERSKCYCIWDEEEEKHLMDRGKSKHLVKEVVFIPVFRKVVKDDEENGSDNTSIESTDGRHIEQFGSTEPKLGDISKD